MSGALFTARGTEQEDEPVSDDDLRKEIKRIGDAVIEQMKKPKGYEHFTAATIEAIRGTCMTHADRVGKTQDEVFLNDNLRRD